MQKREEAPKDEEGSRDVVVTDRGMQVENVAASSPSTALMVSSASPIASSSSCAAGSGVPKHEPASVAHGESKGQKHLMRGEYIWPDAAVITIASSRSVTDADRRSPLIRVRQSICPEMATGYFIR